MRISPDTAPEQGITDHDFITRIIVSGDIALYSGPILRSVGLTPRRAKQVHTDGRPINPLSNNVVVAWQEIRDRENTPIDVAQQVGNFMAGFAEGAMGDKSPEHLAKVARQYENLQAVINGQVSEPESIQESLFLT
jgi:hypothetical protein